MIFRILCTIIFLSVEKLNISKKYRLKEKE